MLRNAIVQWACVGEPFSSLIGCSVANLFFSPDDEADKVEDDEEGDEEDSDYEGVAAEEGEEEVQDGEEEEVQDGGEANVMDRRK